MDDADASIQRPHIEPRLTPQQREELAHIAYFLTQLDTLRARDLIPVESFNTILTEYSVRKDAIERHGKVEAALYAASRLSQHQPQDALAWAERARQLDPTREEAWTMAIDLHARLGQHDAALALCAEAAQQFPALQSETSFRRKLAELQREKERHEAERQSVLEQQRREQRIADLLAQARQAVGEGRDSDVVTFCTQLLEMQPHNIEALALLALAHDRLDNYDESIAVYRELLRLQPRHAGWTARLREVQRRRAEAERASELASWRVGEREQTTSPPTYQPISQPSRQPTSQPTYQPTEPVLTWSTIASEFLKEHWQKLILCLAVLLIVVSSTVGAYHVLPGLFFKAEGKCILALVYTLLFAAFGYGLVKWGAANAGRWMLLTVLLVVPVNFSLVGELRLLIIPTPSNLLVLSVDAAALLFLSWLIAAGMDKKGVGFFAPAFFVLSALNGLTARDVWFSVGFAIFLLSACVFLGAVWTLNTQFEGETKEKHRDFAYFALGLLTYAFLFAAVRAGVFVLQLKPALYALPVMLTAIACVHTAHHLPRFEKETQRVHLLRYGGYVLAGVAFALALARPPVASALFSGNTLATALLGLALFATSLCLYRQPAYLYFSFAALFVAYFGAGYFIGDLMAAIEDTARRALGYEEPLPPYFKSLNGIVFNVVLALLSLQFGRKWKDERLARHCHYIGLPLAIAACVYSCFEPKAAALCLSAYAVLFALAVWLFAQPLLTYLACAAFAGAAFFVSTLLPQVSISAQALGAAGIGFVFWSACSALAYRQVSEAYRAPLVHASLVMSAIALGLATYFILTDHVSQSATLTFFLVALLYVLLGVAYPRPSLSYLAVVTANIGYALAVVYVYHWRAGTEAPPLPAAHFGIAASAVSVALCGLGEWLKRIGQQRTTQPCPEHSRRNGHTSRASLYVFPLFHLALAQVALGIVLCGAQVFGQEGYHRGSPLPSDLASITIALALCAVTLAMTSAFAYRTTELANLAVWTGTAAFGVGVLSGLTAFDVRPLPASLAVAFAALSLLLHLVGERIAPATSEKVILSEAKNLTPGQGNDEILRFAQNDTVALYRDPLLHTAFIAVGVTWLLCALNWNSYPLVAVALALTTLTLTASTRVYPVVPLAHLATVSALGVWLCGFEIATGSVIASPATYGVVVVTFALVLLAVGYGLWVMGYGLQGHDAQTPEPKTQNPKPAAVFASALPDFALVTVFAAVYVLGMGEFMNGIPHILTLALAAIALMWLTQFRRQVSLVYLSLSSAIWSVLCACYWHVSWMPDVELGWMAVATAVIAVALWCAGFTCKRRGVDNFYATPCFVMSLPMTAGTFALVAITFLFTIAGWLKPVALPLCSVALLLNALTYLLLTTVWRTQALTYAAIVSIISAMHLAFTSDHGLLMAVEAIALWLIGFVCQRYERDDTHTPIPPYPHTIYSRPLFISSLLLTLLAVPLAYTSPLAMLLVAVAFLLMVKSFPAAEWLYAVIGSVGCSIYFRFFAGPPDEWLVVACLVAAFALWTLGVIVQRWNGTASVPYRKLGFEFPLFNCAFIASVIAIVIAIVLRVGGAVQGKAGAGWTDHIELLPILAVFYLLMLKPYPHRAWVHVSVALFTLSIGLWAYPFFTSPMWNGTESVPYLLMGMALAHFWLFVQRGLELVEMPLCQRLGVRYDKYSEVVGAWSLAAFAIPVALVAALVLVTVLTTVFTLPPVVDVTAAKVWWSILLTLLLTATYVLLHARDLEADKLRSYIYAVLLCVVWWLGAPSSPIIVTFGVSAFAYYPLATAALALITVLLQRHWSLVTGHRSLIVVALVFTKGVVSPPTIITLLLASATFAVLTVSQRRVEFAYASSAAFVTACEYAVLMLGITAPSELAVCMALGAVVPAFVLLVAAGWLQARMAEQPHTPTPPLPHTAVEHVAFLASLLSAGAVVVSATSAAGLSGNAALLGVSTLLLLTVFYLLLAQRWNAEWLVYAAQVAFVGAYLYFCAANLMPSTWDVVALVMFCFLDFGLSQALERLQLNLYARPTLYFSLLLPFLPLALMVGHWQLNDVNMLLIFSTATFYGVVCYQREWKAAGYAAAVLYNAFLWIVWSRVGWKLADHPQFYLIPVGLSAILFAEVNKRELGRETVNAIRSIGLMVMYVSTAVPLWQFQSFGAWVTLLLLSLLGIFVGIGLRVQAFLWLGLVCFVFDVVYQLGRAGVDHATARWGIGLGLGILLVLFVALNEKMRIVATMREYYEKVRTWE